MKHVAAPMIEMSLLASVLVLAACVGCAEEQPRPTPPDLSALTAAYAAPTGEVTRESTIELLDQAATDLALVSDAQAFIGLIQLMFTDLAGVAEGEDGLAVQRSGLTVAGVEADAGGWIVYHRTCPSANGKGVRGSIEATALIGLDGFEPVIWGALADCRVDGSGMDGDLALHIDWADGAPTGVIGRINGRVNLGETIKDGEFSVRWQGSTVMTQYALAGAGTFVVGVDTVTNALIVDGQNGRFVCDDAGCQGANGGFAW